MKEVENQEKIEFLSELTKIKKHKKSMAPKVTVIVPIYKVERYLAQCLNSIVNQTLEDIEIILIDEGDNDRCREIIDFYAKNDPRIIAPHKKNGGYGASCNLGFEMATGEYIAIVESDDYIELEMYEEMYEYAKKLDADVVKTPYVEFYADGTKRDCSYRKYMNEVTPSAQCFSMKEFGNMLAIHASLWAAIYKTSYIREKNIQFVKAKGGAYVDVGFRIDTLINTDKVAWLDKPYYNYRVDSVGSTTNNFNLKKMIERWKEAHESFNDIKEDYDKYYGKYLILDEYLNTLGWLKILNVSNEEIEGVYKNLSVVKQDTILESPVLDKYQKKDLLEFKENPYCFVKNIRKKDHFKAIINYVVNIMVKIAKPWHLYTSLAFLGVSVIMASYFSGTISTIFKYSVNVWLIMVILYAINICLYEILYLLMAIRRKMLFKKRMKG